MSIYGWQSNVLIEWQELQEKLDNTKKEWETFVQGGLLGENSQIAPEVLSSWQRCRDRNLNPYGDKMEILSGKDLRKRLDDNKDLIEIIKPIVHEIMDSIKDSGYKIDFYDKELYLLVRFGKKTTDTDRRRKEPVLGESHKEIDVGTNATNLAALMEKPVQLVAYEHYRTYYHDLTCVGVPILDKNEKLVGVLTINGYCWPLHKHTMGALIAIKRLVELKLDSSFRSEKELPGIINKELLEAIDSPVVVVDRDSKILAVNNKASESILSGWTSSIGFTSGTVWGENDPFWEALRLKRHITNKSLICEKKGNNAIYNYNVTPIIGPNGKILGAIGVFKNKEIAENQNLNNGSIPRAYYNFNSIVGTSPAIKSAIKLAKETATLDNNVLILGESGTGKELFAQSIHNASAFSAGPFIAVNCSAIPNALLESELFGYEGGSFTGAKKGGSPGKFEMARGGTIFLDELNSMSQDMQAKILRVIQNKTVVRIGGEKEILVNVRIIAATNVDLWDLVQQGDFREDLYYRINVISITIPPLRHRGEDIDLLIDNVKDRISARLGEIISIDDSAREVLCAYSWPGNVRELENVIERSWVIARTNNSNKITMREVAEYGEILDEGSHTIPNSGDTTKSDTISRSGGVVELKNAEAKVIQEALARNRDNIKATAEDLGIARNTLYRKIKKYNLR